MDARQEFVHTAERTFLKVFVDRSPGTSEAKKPMPRQTILEFFDACNTQMNLPEFHEKLIRHIKEHRTPPNEIVVNMQRSMLEIFGFEKEHGCRQLSAIGQNFPKDQELHRGFQVWQQTAQQTCMMLLKRSMSGGGGFPGEVFGDNPLMNGLQEKAKEQLDTMSAQDRGALLQKMQKKISIFAQLPADQRERHMKKLPEEDQIEFVKAQILLVGIMKEQWQQEQQGAGPGPQPGQEQMGEGTPAQVQSAAEVHPEASRTSAP